MTDTATPDAGSLPAVTGKDGQLAAWDPKAGASVRSRPEDLERAFLRGDLHLISDQDYPMVTPEGTTRLVPSKDVADALRNFGMRLGNQNDVIRAEESAPSQKWRAFGDGLLNRATLGFGDAMQVQAGADPDRIRIRAEEHSTARGLGEVMGAVGGGMALGALAPEALAAEAVPEASAATATGRVATTALGTAVEGAAHGVGDAVSEASLGRTDVTAESLLAHGGLGFALGGVLGGALAIPGARALRAADREELMAGATGARPRNLGEAYNAAVDAYRNVPRAAAEVGAEDPLRRMAMEQMGARHAEELANLEARSGSPTVNPAAESEPAATMPGNGRGRRSPPLSERDALLKQQAGERDALQARHDEYAAQGRNAVGERPAELPVDTGAATMPAPGSPPAPRGGGVVGRGLAYAAGHAVGGPVGGFLAEELMGANPVRLAALARAGRVVRDYVADGMGDVVRGVAGNRTLQRSIAPSTIAVLDARDDAERRRAYAERMDELIRFGDPESVADRATRGTNHIADDAPEATNAIRAKAVAAADYLRTAAPRPLSVRNPLAPKPSYDRVSARDAQRFAEIDAAVQDPLRVVDQMRDGRVPSPEVMTAVRTLYPTVYRQMVEGFQLAVAAHPEDIRWSTVIRAGLAFGIAAHPALSPDNLTLQQRVASAPPPQSAPRPRRTPASRQPSARSQGYQAPSEEAVQRH